MARNLCLLLMFAAIAPAQTAGSLEGTVVNSMTREPVKRAMVRLEGQNFQANAVATDDSGRFQFAAVMPGSYTVSAEAQGYTRRAVQPVTVADQQKVSVPALSLRPGGVVSGKVVDADGEPMPNAMVLALVYSYPLGARKLTRVSFATTNDRGEFRMSALIARRYYLMADAPDRKPEPQGRMHRQGPDTAYAPAYYPNSLDPERATPVDVAAGAEAGGIEIRRQKIPLFHVRGKVAGLPEQAIGKTEVTVGNCEPTFLTGSLGAEGNLEAAAIRVDGSFDVPHVSPGTHCVMVQGTFGLARRDISVSDKDVENVALAIAAPFELKGSVVVEGTLPEPFEKLRVMMSPVGLETLFLHSPVNPDGSFVLDGAFPLAYAVSLQMPEGSYLKTIRMGNQESADGRIHVTSGAEPMTILLATDAGQVTGTVKSASGDPVSSMVAIVPAGVPYRLDLFRNGNTDERGRFTVSGVAPGDYEVFALEELDMTAIASPEYRKALDTKAAKVTVHPNGRESVDLTLISADETAAALGKVQ